MYTINVDVLLEVSIHVFTCRYVNQKKSLNVEVFIQRPVCMCP